MAKMNKHSLARIQVEAEELFTYIEGVLSRIKVKTPQEFFETMYDPYQWGKDLSKIEYFNTSAFVCHYVLGQMAAAVYGIIHATTKNLNETSLALIKKHRMKKEEFVYESVRSYFSKLLMTTTLLENIVNVINECASGGGELQPFFDELADLDSKIVRFVRNDEACNTILNNHMMGSGNSILIH